MALRINNRKNISFKKGKGLSTFTKQALIKFIMEGFAYSISRHLNFKLI